jgi:hypothetical protein
LLYGEYCIRGHAVLKCNCLLIVRLGRYHSSVGYISSP